MSSSSIASSREGPDSRVAVLDDQGQHSYASIVERAARVSAALHASNGNQRLAAGERVAILVHPSATSSRRSSACCSRVDVGRLFAAPSRAETRYFCEDAGVRTAVVSAPLRDLGNALEVQSGEVARTCKVVALEPLFETSTSDATALAQAAGESAPALQLYTSGTTGKPKGPSSRTRTSAYSNGSSVTRGASPRATSSSTRLPLHHMHGSRSRSSRPSARAPPRACVRSTPPRSGTKMANATVSWRAADVPSPLRRVRTPRPTNNVRGVGEREATSPRDERSAALPVTIAARWREITA